MSWADALQWGVTAFIALSVALAVTIPKGRAEARKTDSEGVLATAQAERERFERYKDTTSLTIANLTTDCSRCNTELDDTRRELTKVKVAVRALMRALTSNDQAVIDAAVAAVVELV